MEKQKVERINALAHASKERELTPEEKAEQAVLRRAYIDSFKASLEGQLNSITVVEKDGSKHKLEKKK